MFAHPSRGWSTKSKKPSIWKTGQGIDNKGDPSKLWLKVKVQCPPNTLYFISYFITKAGQDHRRTRLLVGYYQAKFDDIKKTEAYPVDIYLGNYSK